MEAVGYVLHQCPLCCIIRNFKKLTPYAKLKAVCWTCITNICRYLRLSYRWVTKSFTWKLLLGGLVIPSQWGRRIIPICLLSLFCLPLNPFALSPLLSMNWIFSNFAVIDRLFIFSHFRNFLTCIGSFYWFLFCFFNKISWHLLESFVQLIL